jgi:hypothetical protein
LLVRAPSTGGIRRIAALVALCSAACGTIDPGPATGPPAGCNASPSFFVEHTWPEYLDRYGCGQASCHDAATGHGYFRLEPVAGATPFDAHQPTSTWPEQWRTDLAAAARLLDCADPGSSQLLLVPEGRGQPHPPGDVVSDHAAADALMAQWSRAL